MSKQGLHLRLRVYKGTSILKDENGNVTNENQKIVLDCNQIKFEKTLQNLPKIGFGRAEIIDFVNDKGEVVEAKESVIELVKEVFKPKTQETKEADKDEVIRNLQERLAKLEQNQSSITNQSDLGTAKETPQAPVKVLDIRKEYKRITGVPAPKDMSDEAVAKAVSELVNQELE